LKGRAYQLLASFREQCTGPEGVFRMSRLILLSRIVPERITAELDDREIEARIEKAIQRLLEQRERQR
jgi:tRNA(Ser,Leu) C12 N-acetylase TAN1